MSALLEYGVFEQDIFAETISGAIAPDQRPKLSQLLEKLSPQDKLVVWKLDRLGRSALDMLQLDRTLQEQQVKLISITEGLDTHTPIGKFYYAILASLAQMERETIRQRVEAGVISWRWARRFPEKTKSWISIDCPRVYGIPGEKQL